MREQMQLIEASNQQEYHVWSGSKVESSEGYGRAFGAYYEALCGKFIRGFHSELGKKEEEKICAHCKKIAESQGLV